MSHYTLILNGRQCVLGSVRESLQHFGKDPGMVGTTPVNGTF